MQLRDTNTIVNRHTKMTSSCFGDIFKDTGQMVAVCDLCGESHRTEACVRLKKVMPVSDSKTPSYARLTVPKVLEIVTLADGSNTVKTKKFLKKNTLFGPFHARSVNRLIPGIRFPLKLFTETGGYYLDTTDERDCNWMCFVEGSVTGFPKANEQNLVCYQSEDDMFYLTCRSILPGEVLKVSYAPHYAKKLGLPATSPRTTQAEVLRAINEKEKQAVKLIVEKLPSSALGVPEEKQDNKWLCYVCGLNDFTVTQYAQHLTTHLKEEQSKTANTAVSQKKHKCVSCDKEYVSRKYLAKHTCCPAKNKKKVAKKNVKMQDVAKPIVADDTAVKDMATFETSDEVASLVNYNPVIVHNDTLDNLLQEFEDNVLQMEGERVEMNCEVQDNDDVMFSIDPHEMTLTPTHDPTAVQPLLNVYRHYSSTKANHIVFDNQFLSGQKPVSFSSSLGYNLPGDELDKPMEEDFTVSNPNDSFAAGHFLDDHLFFEKGPKKIVDKLDGKDVDCDTFKLPEISFNCDNSSSLTESSLSKLERNILIEVEKELPNEGLADRNFDLESNVSLNDDKRLSNDPELSFYLDPNISVDLEKELFGKGQADESFISNVDDIMNRSFDISFLPPATLSQPATIESFDDIEMSLSLSENKTLVKETVECAICSKKFGKNAGLIRHMKKHTGQFTCSYCQMVFARNESLLHHKCIRKPVATVPNNWRGDVLVKCELCDKMFLSSDTRGLTCHIQAVHKKRWMCKYCNGTYSSMYTLKLHRCPKNVQPSQQFDCPHCKKTFTMDVYLKKHVANVHAPTQRCAVCDKRIVRNEFHEMYCSEAKELENAGVAKCPQCFDMFVDIVAYREHALTHTHAFNCANCGLRFVSNKLRESHLCHPMACDLCLRQFDAFGDYKAHVATHGVPAYYCFECGISYHTAEGLSSHDCANQGYGEVRKSQTENSKKHKEPPLMCHACGSNFQHPSTLNKHMDTHGEPRFACDICDRKFHRSDLLRFHKSVHEDTKVACTYPNCGATFKNRKTMATHLRQHKTGMMFACVHCERAFYQKVHLEKHIQVHKAARKMFNCDVCDKPFSSRYSMGKHKRQHLTGKPYKCTRDKCKKAYGSEDFLREHMKSCHESVYVCPCCNKSITFRCSMKRHLLNTHKDSIDKKDVESTLDRILCKAVGSATPPSDVSEASR